MMVQSSKRPVRSVRRRSQPILIGAAFALVAGLALRSSLLAAEDARAIPAPVVDEAATGAPTETAIFAGGCFWGVQGVFQHVDGVISAVSGYAGGAQATAQYHVVSTGTTGHAEAVKVVFNPKRISYGHLLQVFFSVAHNPTELDAQGPDTGPQYRSAIFPTSASQARVAESYIAQLSGAHVYPSRIVTTIEPGKAFYPAEAYHQDFLTRNPTYPYIAVNDLPKIGELKRLLPDIYRPDPVLVAMADRPPG